MQEIAKFYATPGFLFPILIGFVIFFFEIKHKTGSHLKLSRVLYSTALAISVLLLSPVFSKVEIFGLSVFVLPFESSVLFGLLTLLIGIIHWQREELNYFDVLTDLGIFSILSGCFLSPNLPLKLGFAVFLFIFMRLVGYSYRENKELSPLRSRLFIPTVSIVSLFLMAQFGEMQNHSTLTYPVLIFSILFFCIPPISVGLDELFSNDFWIGQRNFLIYQLICIYICVPFLKLFVDPRSPLILGLSLYFVFQAIWALARERRWVGFLRSVHFLGLGGVFSISTSGSLELYFASFISVIPISWIFLNFKDDGKMRFLNRVLFFIFIYLILGLPFTFSGKIYETTLSGEPEIAIYNVLLLVLKFGFFAACIRFLTKIKDVIKIRYRFNVVLCLFLIGFNGIIFYLNF